MFEATYQRGDKASQKSGNIYMNGKPRFGHNQVYKEKVGALLLTERLKWNDDIKMYHAKLYSYEQAAMVLEASKMVSGDDERDLANVSFDRSMFRVPQMHIFPLELDTKEDGKVLHTAIAGDTYPCFLGRTRSRRRGSPLAMRSMALRAPEAGCARILRMRTRKPLGSSISSSISRSMDGRSTSTMA